MNEDKPSALTLVSSVPRTLPAAGQCRSLSSVRIDSDPVPKFANGTRLTLGRKPSIMQPVPTQLVAYPKLKQSLRIITHLSRVCSTDRFPKKSYQGFDKLIFRRTLSTNNFCLSRPAIDMENRLENPRNPGKSRIYCRSCVGFRWFPGWLLGGGLDCVL